MPVSEMATYFLVLSLLTIHQSISLGLLTHKMHQFTRLKRKLNLVQKKIIVALGLRSAIFSIIGTMPLILLLQTTTLTDSGIGAFVILTSITIFLSTLSSFSINVSAVQNNRHNFEVLIFSKNLVLILSLTLFEHFNLYSLMPITALIPGTIVGAYILLRLVKDFHMILPSYKIVFKILISINGSYPMKMLIFNLFIGQAYKFFLYGVEQELFGRYQYTHEILSKTRDQLKTLYIVSVNKVQYVNNFISEKRRGLVLFIPFLALYALTAMIAEAWLGSGLSFSASATLVTTFALISCSGVFQTHLSWTGQSKTLFKLNIYEKTFALAGLLTLVIYSNLEVYLLFILASSLISLFLSFKFSNSSTFAPLKIRTDV